MRTTKTIDINKFGILVMLSKTKQVETTARIFNGLVSLKILKRIFKINNNFELINSMKMIELDNSNSDIIRCLNNLMNIEIPIPSLEDQKKFINIYKEKEEIHKIKFLDKIEDENKHIELLNEISKNIFNQ